LARNLSLIPIMSAPKTILIPIDFSDISLKTLEYAADIAHKIDAELHVLHVMETYQYNAALGMVTDNTEPLRKEAEGLLDDFRSEHSKMWGLPLRTHLRNGKIYSEIIDMAKTLKPEFIVMSTYGASGVKNLQKYFLGSNAYRVVNSAKCPVLTIRKPKKSPSFKNILVPIDITTATEQKVTRAVRWAKAFGATIHAISISETVDALRGRGRTAHKKLDEIAARIEAAGVKCEASHFYNKPVAETVMNYAEVHKMDVIFIMTHKESGASTKFLGSTARTIIEHSTVPVLSLHPKG